MVDKGRIQGSEALAKPLIVGKDIVYVHTDIQPVTTPDAEGNVPEGLFEYTEIQYDKDEYIQIMADKVEEAERTSENVMLALTELYEASLA